MSHPSNLPERAVTPEAVALSRRKFLFWGSLGAGAVAAGTIGYLWYEGTDNEVLASGRYDYPAKDLYPAQAAGAFRDAGRPLTAEIEAARHCNFYEFTATKSVWRHVEGFRPVPWTVEVGGLVDHPKTY